MIANYTKLFFTCVLLCLLLTVSTSSQIEESSDIGLEFVAVLISEKSVVLPPPVALWIMPSERLWDTVWRWPTLELWFTFEDEEGFTREDWKRMIDIIRFELFNGGKTYIKFES